MRAKQYDKDSFLVRGRISSGLADKRPLLPDLTSLVLLLRTVESGSLSKAAANMHLVLSAASRRVRMLEQQYGVSLLDRMPGGGVRSTRAGVALAAHVKRIMRDIDELTLDLADFAGGAKMIVRLHANPSAMGQELPQALAAFSERHPDIRVLLEEAIGARIVQSVTDGLADIGVVMDGDLGSLLSVPYRLDPLCVVLPKRHPLKARRVNFSELLKFDFIGLETGTTVIAQMQAAALAAGKRLRLRAQVQSYEAVCRMVEAGHGIGILPEGALRIYMSGLQLRFVALSDEWAMQRRMVLCMRPSDVSSPVRLLAEFLTDFVTAGPRPA